MFAAMAGGFSYWETSAPRADALVTSVSLWAQFLLNQRKLETWALWLVVNLFYVGLYVHQELLLLALLHLVYVGLSVQGLRSWAEKPR